MNILQAIILGIVQGLTEYLPVSSSAHLVFVPYLMGWQLDPQISFAFDVLVQMGTLLAVVVYFWKDLLRVTSAWINGIRKREPFTEPDSRLGWYLIIATIPAGIAGLLFKDAVETVFQSPLISAVFLVVTAGMLAAGEHLGKRLRGLAGMTPWDAFWMGLMQALAIFPGISRSGATISGGLISGVQRQAAARFSFLMSIPIMLTAGIMAGRDLTALPNLSAVMPVITIGFIVSAVVGYLSIRWLLGYIQKNSFRGFTLYCLTAGILMILIILIKG